MSIWAFVASSRDCRCSWAASLCVPSWKSRFSDTVCPDMRLHCGRSAVLHFIVILSKCIVSIQYQYIHIHIYIYELYTLDVDYHWLICFYHVICMKQDPDHHIKVLKLWILCAAPGSGGSGPTPVGGWSRGGCHTNNRGFLVAATTIPKKHPVILTMGWWWLMMIDELIDWLIPSFLFLRLPMTSIIIHG